MSDGGSLRPVAVIGARLDLGAGRRGVDMGPSAIRYAGLQERIARLGRVCVDWGDVEVGVAEATEVGDPHARYLDVDQALVRARRGARRARRAPAASSRSSSAATTRSRSGTLGGMASGARRRRRALDRCARRPQPPRDLAERQRPRHAARGRASASPARRSRATPGRRRRVERAALVGVRSLDDGERELIGELDVRVFTMSEIDRHRRRARACARRSRSSTGRAFLHVSVDLDAVDPMFAPGRRHAGARRPLLPRGPPRARARRRVGPARLARARRGQPDPRPRERDRPRWRSSSPRALSARGSSDPRRAPLSRRPRASRGLLARAGRGVVDAALAARPAGSRPRSRPGRRAGRRSPAPRPSLRAPG